jgi:hypothetical protein
MGDRGNNNLARSGHSGGLIRIVRDPAAGRIVDSPFALDVSEVEIERSPDGLSPLDRKWSKLGRPMRSYWAAEDDWSNNGAFVGFFASSFITTIDDDYQTRLAGSVQGSDKPITRSGGKAAVNPRFSILDRRVLVDKTSAVSGKPISSRVREKPVQRLLGITGECSDREALVTIEEPVLVSSWRGDPRHSNLVYDIREKGRLDDERNARISDMMKVVLSEQNVPTLAINYGSAPDQACLGYGMVVNGSGIGYMDMGRGGPIYVSPSAPTRHGQNSDGERVTGAMLKFLGRQPATGRTAVQSQQGASGSVFHGSDERSGPIIYDGRDYQEGKGARVVEAWLAWDGSESWSYGKCGGAGNARGAFKFNSWVNEFDPYPGVPPLPPETPTTPPYEDPPIGPPPEPGVPTTGGGGNSDDSGDPTVVGGPSSKVKGPSVGVSEVRRPSYSGMPVPPKDAEPTGEEPIGDDGGTGVAHDEPSGPEDFRDSEPPPEPQSEGDRRAAQDAADADERERNKPPGEGWIRVKGGWNKSEADSGVPGGIFVSDEEAERLRRERQRGAELRREVDEEEERERRENEAKTVVESSRVEDAIGVDYGRLRSGQYIGNDVWFDRFSNQQSQISLRNMIRAPHVAHWQVVGKYDSTSKSWVTDGNKSCYVDVSGDGTTYGETLPSTLMVMPPNIDLGDADLAPTSGVTKVGLACHSANGQGFIGVGKPYYPNGCISDGFKISYDGDVQITAVGATGTIDATADAYFTGDYKAFAGQGREIAVGEGVIENTSTGAYAYDGSSVASASSVNIGAGSGHIVNSHDSSEEADWTYAEVSWSAQVVSIASYATPGVTYLYADSSGVIQQQTSPLTETQLRENIYLCRAIHTTGAVTSTFDNPYYILNPMTQVNEFFDIVGIINRSVLLYPNTTGNLKLSSTGGSLFVRGGNVVASRAAPNSIAIASDLDIPFRYIDQDTGGAAPDITDVIPGSYDVSGTVTAIPGSSNRATIQRIYLFPSGAYRIAYGQQYYTSLSDAESAIISDTIDFVENPFIAGNGVLAALLIVTKGCTDLTDTSKAKVVLANALGQAFGGGSGGGSGTSYWNRAGTTLSPTTSGDDVEIDGVLAVGDATVNALRCIGVSKSAADGSNYDGIRAEMISATGATGDNNAFSVLATKSGNNAQTNVRGFVVNASNDASGGTATNFNGGEILVAQTNASSTITNKHGLLARILNTGGGTATAVYGLKGQIEGNGTNVVGVEGRIVSGAATTAYGLSGVLTSGVSVTSMSAGLLAVDLEDHPSGRSAAIYCVGASDNVAIGFGTSTAAFPIFRLRADTTTDTLHLDNNLDEEIHFEASGAVRATTGFCGKDVDITSDNTTHNAAWGERIVVDVSSGSSGVTVNLPEASVGGDGTNRGKEIVIEVHESGTGPTTVTVNVTGADTLKYQGSDYASWSSSTDATVLSVKAGYDRAIYACCESGGTFNE